MPVPSGVRVGCIADDLAGATDLAGMLVRHGVTTHLHVGVPDVDELRRLDTEAVVVALPSRTALAADAVNWSLASARAFVGAGATHFYFRYGATFDSTPEGNIGPVADVLAHALGAKATAICPASPATGHTVYGGHLFADGVLLSDSPMASHPVTPMTDANLVRWLRRQSVRPIEHVGYDTVSAGADAVRQRFGTLVGGPPCHVVCDALDDHHIDALARALSNARLVTGESALAGALVAPWRAERLLGPAQAATAPVVAPGGRVVIAGSCSASTRAQVRAAREAGLPVVSVDPIALASHRDELVRLCNVAVTRMSAAGDKPVVIAATAEPEAIEEVHAALGRSGAGLLVERALARVGRELVQAGATQVLVAGGETSDAVVDGLGLTDAHVSGEVAPGVPWTWTDEGLAMAFKSGDFGGDDFFSDAFAQLEASQ